ncbi:MAG: diguanylate cyclase [Burkholderiaceae bacterium]|nr:MAG: diguanylate cyclase [Burkholderiaceae bacterium]
MLPFSRTESSHFLLVAAVTLFVVLDLSVLAINYGIVWRVDQDTVVINIAGRQRMLTERMTKALLLLQDATNPEAARSARDELRDSAQQFTQTLAAFQHGGPVIYSNGKKFTIPPLADADTAEMLATGQRLWAGIEPLIQPLLPATLPPPGKNDADLITAIAVMRRDGPALVRTMNQLTTQIEMHATRSTRYLRAVHTGAFLLALANFVVILTLLRRRYREALRGLEVLRDLIDQIGAGVCLVDDQGRILAANKAAGALIGRDAARLQGMLFERLLERDEDVWVSHLPDGNVRALDVVHGSFNAAQISGTVMTLLDVSSRYTERNLLRHLANHDQLTGLPNRRLLYDRMLQALAHARRSHSKIGVALIDINGFKSINDQYGHAAGDAVLCQVAQRLAAAVREGDTLARVGGDEYVGLFPGPIETAELDHLMQRLHECFSQPFETDIAQVKLTVRASIGLAEYPRDGETTDTLLRAADKAMYRIKHSEAAEGATPFSRRREKGWG